MHVPCSISEKSRDLGVEYLTFLVFVLFIHFKVSLVVDYYRTFGPDFREIK